MELKKKIEGLINVAIQVGIVLSLGSVAESTLAFMRGEKEPWYKTPILYLQLIGLTILTLSLIGIRDLLAFLHRLKAVVSSEVS